MTSEAEHAKRRLRLLQGLFVYNPLRVYLQRKFEAPRVLSGLGLPGNSHCIEIGCGHGAGTLLISQAVPCARIVGIDNDPDVVALAKRYVGHLPVWARCARTSHIEFACEDAASLSYPDGSFDAAFLFGVLNSVDDWKKVVFEVHRVLRPGGVFSFKEALRPPTRMHLARLYFFSPTITADALKKCLTRTGFTIRSFETIRHPPGCFVRVQK